MSKKSWKLIQFIKIHVLKTNHAQNVSRGAYQKSFELNNNIPQQKNCYIY